MKWYTLACALIVLVACGGDTPTSPATGGLNGGWTGNLASMNWNSAAIEAQLTQTGSTVTGTWASAAFDWQGTITGTINSSRFNGTFTISTPQVGGGLRCTGNASISGPIGATLQWTGAGFTGSCGNLPVGVTFNLQRR